MWLYLVAHTLVCVVREQEWDFGTCSSWVSRLRMASYYLCKGSSVCIELADSRIPYSLNWCCTCIRQGSSVHLLGLYLLPFFLESWLGSRTVLRLSRSDHQISRSWLLFCLADIFQVLLGVWKGIKPWARPTFLLFQELLPVYYLPGAVQQFVRLYSS